MVFLIILFMLITPLHLAAQYFKTEQPVPAYQTAPATTGYVLVPEDKMKEVLTPKKEGPTLRELSSAALAGKIETLQMRTELTTKLKDYQAASKAYKDAEATLRDLQKIIKDREKVRDEKIETLKTTINKAQEKITQTKAKVKQLRDEKKAAKKPAEANEAERVAAGVEEIVATVEATINQAVTEVTKEKPDFKP